MEKFHITITNNETGETKYDQDTSAVVAAFDRGDWVQCIILANCDVFSTASVMDCIQNAIKKELKTDPELRRAVKFAHRVNKAVK